MTINLVTHNRRLRILFITAWYPQRAVSYDGVFVREHALAVARRHDVAVIHCPGPQEGLPRAWQAAAETDPALTAGLPTWRAWYRRARPRQWTMVWRLLAVLQAVSALRRSGFRPDLLHAHVYDAGFIAAAVSKLYRRPFIVTEHISSFPRQTLPPLEVAKARIAFGQAARVLPVSRALQSGIERYGIQARFQIVGNVVDTDLFQPPASRHHTGDPLRLLSVGSLTPVKGLPDLLAALRQLDATLPPWRLDVVGDGPQRAAYTALAAELGLAQRVVLHGARPKPEVAAFMRQADLFVLPSQWENLPCVLLEALASGTPIVASSVGGIPEVVDRNVGILTPPADPAALAAALTAALANLEQFDRDEMMRRAARFSPDAIGDTLDAIYQSVLESDAHGARRLAILKPKPPPIRNEGQS